LKLNKTSTLRGRSWAINQTYHNWNGKYDHIYNRSKHNTDDTN